MQDHVSRLVGLDGFRVVGVVEDGDQLDLEVELVARANSCPHCSGTKLQVHERPVVRVRDLPYGGRRAALRWRKRRYRLQRMQAHPHRVLRAGAAPPAAHSALLGPSRRAGMLRLRVITQTSPDPITEIPQV